MNQVSLWGVFEDRQSHWWLASKPYLEPIVIYCLGRRGSIDELSSSDCFIKS